MEGQEEKTRINHQGFLRESFHQQSLTGDQSRDTLLTIFIKYLE